MDMENEYKGISEKGDYTQEELGCALDCLVEAEKIQGNPQLLKLVQQYATKKVGDIKSVQDIRNASYDMNEEDKGKKKKLKVLPEALKEGEAPESLLEKVRNRLSVIMEFE